MNYILKPNKQVKPEMPERKLYLTFDALLMRQGVVGVDDYSSIHDWMDEYKDTKGTEQPRELILDINEVKSWLSKKCDSVNQELLSEYLRVALGHLLLDSLWANFSFKNEYEFMKMATQFYDQKGFGRCFF